MPPSHSHSKPARWRLAAVAIVTLLLAICPEVLGGVYTTDEFTFSCLPLTIQRTDPIVSPGGLAAHVHAVVGGTAFQSTMGVDTAKNAKGTTCGVAIDKSNYWIPQLYYWDKDESFEIIEFQGGAIYYLNRTCDYSAGAASCGGGFYPLAPPAGLRILAGDPDLRTYNDSIFAQRAISHMCIKEDGSSSETKHLPQQACSKLRSQVFFPSCWDGMNLDSPDHKSHMAYPAIGDYNKGVCPQTHPVAIYSIFAEFFFNTEPFPDHENWIYSTADSTGHGLHGDFINGWTDQDALQQAVATCTGEDGVQSQECSLTEAQNEPIAPTSQSLEVPPPSEEVGQNDPISELPGPNEVPLRAPRFNMKPRATFWTVYNWHSVSPW